MHKKKLFILGKILSDYTSGINKDLYDVYLLKDSTLPEKEYRDLVDIYKVDYQNKDAFISSIKNIEVIPDAILCLYENYIPSKAWAGEYYNLGILTEEAAIAATNKLVMRESFQNYDPTITPAYINAKSFEDIKSFTTEYGFPIILKPANLSKSLLINKCKDITEAESYYNEMQRLLPDIYKKYNIYDKSGYIIAEQYLEGSMHTVAAFTDKESNVYLCDDIVDNITARDIGMDDNYLYLRSIPSTLSAEQKDQVLEVAKKGMKALNLKASAGHVEVFFTKDGPKLIEIGARLGGYRSRMYRLSSGIDLVQADISANLGDTVNLNKVTNNYCSVFEIFPDTEGTFDKIEAIDNLVSLESYYSHNINVKSEKIGPAKKGYKFVLNIILCNKDKSILDNDVNFVRNNIKVLTK